MIRNPIGKRATDFLGFWLGDKDPAFLVAQAPLSAYRPSTSEQLPFGITVHYRAEIEVKRSAKTMKQHRKVEASKAEPEEQGTAAMSKTRAFYVFDFG